MQILFRYILRQALGAVVAMVILSILISSLISLFDILDDVIKSDLSLGMFWRYLWVTTTPNVQFLLPVLLILGGLVTTGNLSRRQEVTAMWASGLPPRTVILPLVVVALCISAADVWLIWERLPALRLRALEMKEELKINSGARGQPLRPGLVAMEFKSVRLEGEVAESGESFSDATLLILNEGSVVESHRMATLARDESGQWTMADVLSRKLDPATGQVISFEHQARMVYPAEWPAPEALIEAYRKPAPPPEVMTVPQLLAAKTPDEKMELHRRLADAIALGIGFLAGAAFGLGMERFNMARALIYSFLIGFSYRFLADGLTAVSIYHGGWWMIHLTNVLLLIAPFALRRSREG